MKISFCNGGVSTGILELGFLCKTVATVELTNKGLGILMI